MGLHILVHCYKDALNATKRLHSLIECTFDIVYEITLKLACNMDLQWMAEAVLPRFVLSAQIWRLPEHQGEPVPQGGSWVQSLRRQF